MWDVSTGKELATLQDGPKESSKMHAVTYSPDGKTLATGFREVVRLWKPEKRTLLRTIHLGLESKVTSLAFVAGGKVLVLGGIAP